MNVSNLIDSLERFGRLLPAVVAGISDADSRWKAPDRAWSILEIVCHLADEEEFDFRERIRLTLTDPTIHWPPLDPEGAAVVKRYNEGDLAEAAARFSRLRSESVAWLRSLVNPDWTRTYQHPQFGPFPAGDLFAAWTAHDALHLRQIAKRMYQMSVRDAEEFSTRYAGEWKE